MPGIFKKTYLNIFLVFIFTFFAFSASAITFDPPTSMNTTQDLVASITNWLLGVTSGIVILFLIIGGIMYMTSRGNQEGIDRGKKIITYSVIGLVVILISYSIITALNKIIFG